MKLKVAALVFAMTLASCTSLGTLSKTPTPPPKPVHKEQPVKPAPAPTPTPAPKPVQGDITKTDKDHIKDLLDQAIHTADCSDLASKDDPSCAK